MLVTGDSNMIGTLAVTAITILGDALVVRDLTVSGALNAEVPFNFFNFNISGDLSVGIDADIRNNLTVSGDGLFYGDVTILGDLSANVDVTFDGVVQDLTVTNDAFIGNDISVGRSLAVDSDCLVVGDLTVSGAIQGNINVSFTGVVDNLTVSGTMTVGPTAGTALFTNPLVSISSSNIQERSNIHNVIAGTLTADCTSISYESTLLSLRATQFDILSDELRITAANLVTIGEDVIIPGDLSVSGNLIANISTSFNGVVTDLSVSNDATIGNDLTVSGGLNVFGANSFFENDVLITGTLSANNLDFNNVLINNLDVTNDLTVTGNTNLIGDLFVTGSLTDIRTDMIVEGDLSVSGNLIGLDCTCSSLITSGFILAQEDISTSQSLVGNTLSIGSDSLIGGNLTVSGLLSANIAVSFTGVVDNLSVSNDAVIGNDLTVGGDARLDSISIGITTFQVTVASNTFNSTSNSGFIVHQDLNDLLAGGVAIVTMNNPIIDDNSMVLIGLAGNNATAASAINIDPFTITPGELIIQIANDTASTVVFGTLRFYYHILNGVTL